MAAVKTTEQLVFSGPVDSIEAVALQLQQEPLGSCRRLTVSGPWHSPAMTPAQEAFGQYLAGLEFRTPTCSLVLNVTGAPESDPAAIRTRITQCLTEPVQWRISMECLKNAGVHQLIEVVPGRVLAGLARANGFGNEVQVASVGTLRAADRTAGPPLCDSPAARPADTLPL